MRHDSAPDFGQPFPVPPPVPPAVPPPVPPRGFAEPESEPEPKPEPEPAFAAEPDEPPPPFRIRTRRSFRGPPRGDGGTGFVLTLLLVAAAGMLAYVSWPQLTAQLKSDLGLTRRRLPAGPPTPEPDVQAAPGAARRHSAASAEPSAVAAAATTKPRRDDDPVVAVATEPATVDRRITAGSPFEEPRREFPPLRPAPGPTSAPPQPSEPRPGVPAAERPGLGVDAALRAAVRALRTEDWATARDRLDEAEAAADDDDVARVARWRRLLAYAEGFGPLRARALAASVGNEYTVDGKMISIVEANDTRFVFRRLGRNKSMPSQQIPRAIVVEIVTRWFAGANRPANDLFLGAYHACREDPNIPRARAAWQKASERGLSDANELLLLLDDPVLLAVDP